MKIAEFTDEEFFTEMLLLKQDEGGVWIAQGDLERLIKMARIGASVMPRPIEEADNDYRQDYALFDETEGGWCAGSWDDDENGWFTASGQINPAHFIPLSALPKPAEVTT